MTDAAAGRRSPLVLLANAQEWVSRSFESVLRPAGYDVVKAYTGPHALEVARRGGVDAIILDSTLPETDALVLCRALRVDPYVTPSTPILITVPGPLARPQVLDALRAGANGVWGQPFDSEEFLLRLESLLRAKLDADQARDGGLLDPRTGLYNLRGLERQARGLAAQVDRREAWLACVVLAPEADAPTLTESLGRTLRAAARGSDSVGRLSAREFAVLAPDTDGDGAVQLFRRLLLALERRTKAGRSTLRLRAGYDARSGFRTASLDPALLLERARSALQTAQQAGGNGGGTIRAFEGGPTPS
jgi:PleD family two-component response regulator